MVHDEVEAILAWISDDALGSFKDFEDALVPRVFVVARLLITLFLAVREERVLAGTPERVVADGRAFRRRPAKARNLATFFGVVRYWRVYLRGEHGTGYHPLDLELGLLRDRVSMKLISLGTRLCTKLSFAQAQAVLRWFLGTSPSTEVLEQAVLGLGRSTGEWFENVPPPEDDGGVLVIEIDSKACPTATDSELERRRRKRPKRRRPKSQRHRGRKKRARYGKKPRRKKGDKSKNGKAATLVVMYSLKKRGKLLEGPLNKRVYASFAPKRHAFEYARREADKRGFGRDSNKTVQVVTDGDDDLAVYAKELFPEAIHTIDVMHVIEYLWTAGECIHREGSSNLSGWVEAQKDRLYEGRVHQIVTGIIAELDRIPTRGPGNSARRRRLSKVLDYLTKRMHLMNYDELIRKDLVIATGVGEGAVKHVIAARFDHGGMRWIRQRAEALLQLRCIEINGDWDRFIDWIHDKTRAGAQRASAPIRLQQNAPSPLPNLAKAV